MKSLASLPPRPRRHLVTRAVTMIVIALLTVVQPVVTAGPA
ncbi:hypothetical protein HNP84_010389, partial [Thermocatellispora tengchongensis]|nr:hypothetical protein [Thermocatellispora tengchongensis]